MDEDIFELHVCEKGRWSCVERFRSAEREEAVNEANRHFASSTVEAVRVIREAFDEAEQVFKQRTVYRNAKPKADIPTFTAKAAAPRKPAAPARPVARPDPPAAKSAPKPAPDAVRLGAIKRAEPAMLSATYALVRRLLIAAAIGLVLSGSVFLAERMSVTKHLFEQIAPEALNGGIVLLFVISFFISLYLFSRTEGRARNARAAAQPGAAAAAAAVGAAAEQPVNWLEREIPIGAPEPAPTPKPEQPDETEVAELAAEAEKPKAPEPEKPPEPA